MDFIQEQNKQREDYKIIKRQSYLKIILSNRSTKGIFFLLAFAIVVPVLIYYFVIDKGVHLVELGDTCSVDRAYRITCGRPNATLSYCSGINCCFDNSTKLCFHYLPSKYYYFNDGKQENGVYQTALAKSPFNKNISTNIQLTVNTIDENNLEIILHDPNITVESNDITTKLYSVNITRNPLYVEVYRNNSNQDLLLTTAKGPLIISEKYWEWSFQLTDEYLFGLGQTLIEVKANSTLTKVIYGNSKDHNTLPVFMAYKNGSYHGLVVTHVGPLEVTVLPSKLVTLKSLAGQKIILKLSVGPTVQEVMKQQKNNTFVDVDLETLGVHVCREGSSISVQKLLDSFEKDTNGVDYIKFRYDSDCIHENLVTALMNENKPEDTTKVKTAVEKILSESRRFVLALPLQVLDESTFYKTTKNFSVFYQTTKGNTTDDYRGKFLGSKVVYPYFGHNSIDQFLEAYTKQLNEFFDELPKYYILGYNWPSDDSFEMKESEEHFQYLSEFLTEAMSSTLPWNVTSQNDLHFYHHINYAALQIEKLKTLLAKSTFMTASHNFDNSEPLIIQNVDPTWTNFEKAIITTLYNSIFGYPLTSVPVCGSTANFNSSHESLCMRWYLMASTAPIFRISSSEPKRDPNSLATMTTKLTGNKAKEAIDFRYSLRYYFYTVLKNEEPLMRPMFYDFPDDNETFPLVHQYMVGSSLLVAHPTLPQQTQISVYLPKAAEMWYEFGGGKPYLSKNGTWVTLFIVETDWIAFMPEGVIIPFTETSDNGENITLKIALKCDSTSTCSASGFMRLGNENFLNLTSTEKELNIVGNTVASSNVSVVLSSITIYNNNLVTTCNSLDASVDSTSWTYSYENCI